MTLKHLAILFLAAALPSLAADGYTAYKMTAPPGVDGKLDDPGWKGVPWAYGFRNLYEQWTFSPKQTAFKIAHDQDFLYLALRCCEPEMAKVKVGERAFDGWPTILDDIYFIYANSYNTQGTWEDSPFKILQLGAGGIHRALTAKGETPAPLEWKTAYRADDRDWWLESAIPLKLLEIDPAKGGFFNVVRHLQTIPGGWPQRTSSWNLVANAKLDQHTLSPLRFSPDNGVANVGVAEDKLATFGGIGYGWWLGQQLGKIKDRGGDYAAAKTRLANSPSWPLADNARQEVEAVMAKSPGDLGAKTNAYLDWQFALAQMADVSAPLRLEIQTSEASAKVFLNGGEVHLENGVSSLLLVDGANALAVEAKATGSKPGVAMKLPAFPETDGRWAVDSAPADGWRMVEFDDLAWPSPAGDGRWMWAGHNAKEASFRQVLLWSRSLYGGKLANILPPHTEYGISPGTTEVLQHAIFAPTGQPMESYVLQIELPEGFRLLDCECRLSRPYCWNPSGTSACKFEIDGRPYVQHSLKYDVAKLQGCNCALLPVKHENYHQPQGRAVFRFRRLINKNVTELANTLDVRMLPPVNGRRMRTILYPQYDHQADQSVSDELLSELVRQGVAAGMDMWICGPKWILPNQAAEKARVKAYKLIQDNGGRIMASFPDAMPLWGAEVYSELYKLVKENPKFAAVYFNNTGNRHKDWSLNFCFTYALGEGRKDFAAALLRDYRRWQADLPDAKMLFLNNESYPWEFQGTDLKPGAHCYCFCDRCKEAFEKFAGLPANKPLSDEEIYSKHKGEWAKFWRENQSGRLMELVKETANAVGLETVYYHNTGDKDAWRVVSGKSDRYCVGFPGGAAFVNRNSQPGLDDTMKFFESIGIPPFIGQRRTYFPLRSDRARGVSSKDGWSLNPKAMKAEIVRMAATTHGGVVYESVMQLTGGSLYYFGEATRLIATYESLFHDGKRDDALADAGEHKYPDILVLTKGDERLVLVFNETKEPKTFKLNNHKLKPGQQAEIFEKHGKIADPQTMEIVIPPEDVIAVHLK